MNKPLKKQSMIMMVGLGVLTVFLVYPQQKLQTAIATTKDIMLFADRSRGRPFSKDPDVVNFNGKYYMYYSIPPFGDGRPRDGWAIGIAGSNDLQSWNRIGDILPVGEYEKKGLAAPAAIVLNKQVHLFYQNYGNGPKDAICHAFSDDGIPSPAILRIRSSHQPANGT
jgi:hypothetical protein